MNLKHYLYLFLATLFLSSCTDNTASTKDSFTLQGIVLSSYDQSIISKTEVLLDGVVVDTTDQNGRFAIVDLEAGDYNLEIRAAKDHRALVISRFSIISTDVDATLFLPFKYNLIESIGSSESVTQARSLIESYNMESSSAILNDNSRITFTFNNYIIATDTIEFAYFHGERPSFNFNDDPLFEHGIRITYEDTDHESNIIIGNYNDEVLRTIQFQPTSMGNDSSKVLELSIIPNLDFTVEELNLIYFTSY